MLSECVPLSGLIVPASPLLRRVRATRIRFLKGTFCAVPAGRLFLMGRKSSAEEAVARQAFAAWAIFFRPLKRAGLIGCPGSLDRFQSSCALLILVNGTLRHQFRDTPILVPVYSFQPVS
jgi:hypothetical protein